jgi:hypothetical protein
MEKLLVLCCAIICPARAAEAIVPGAQPHAKREGLETVR